MRLNNKSARLTVNNWLATTDHPVLPASLSYEQFATELRKVRAKTLVQVPFTDRAEAVAYIRDVAKAVMK